MQSMGQLLPHIHTLTGQPHNRPYAVYGAAPDPHTHTYGAAPQATAMQSMGQPLTHIFTLMGQPHNCCYAIYGAAPQLEAPTYGAAPDPHTHTYEAAPQLLLC